MSEYKTEIFKNEDGFFRVKIWGYMDTPGNGRWLMDSDIMTAMVSSHRSKELTFGSVASAQQGIADFHRTRESVKILGSKTVKPQDVKYSETWESIEKK